MMMTVSNCIEFTGRLRYRYRNHATSHCCQAEVQARIDFTTVGVSHHSDRLAIYVPSSSW